MSPSRGENLLTQLSKLHRKTQELESEQRNLNEELEKLDRDEFARLKDAAMSDEKPDLSEIRNRRSEAKARIEEIEKEVRAKKAYSEDLSEDYGIWDHGRLSKLFQKQTLVVVEARKKRDAAQEVLDEAERQLLIVTNERHKTKNRIYLYEHGGPGEKLKKFRDMEPSEAELAKRQWLKQCEKHYRERDNAIFRDIETYPPGDVLDRSRFLNLPSTIATYEKWHESNWTFRVNGEDEIRPPVRPENLPDPFEGMSIEAMTAVPYQKMLELAKITDPEKRENLITMYHAMGEQILHDAGRR